MSGSSATDFRAAANYYEARVCMKKEKRIIYYENELTDEFSEARIDARRIDGSYDYVPREGAFKFLHFFWYRIIATPIALLYTGLRHAHRIIGKEKLKKFKRCGYFLYGNHTHHLCDAVVPSLITLPKDTYVIVHPANVSIPFVGKVAPYMGAIPLPDDREAYKNFKATVTRRYGEKNAICIYPEAHIWPYYTGIRPFGDDSFSYPVSLGSPVFCFTNTYRKRGRGAGITTYIDGPFFPDPTLSARDARQKLRNEVYSAMCERARLSEVEMIEYRRKENNEAND